MTHLRVNAATEENHWQAVQQAARQEPRGAMEKLVGKAGRVDGRQSQTDTGGAEHTRSK
jgi:hypothetical protein